MSGPTAQLKAPPGEGGANSEGWARILGAGPRGSLGPPGKGRGERCALGGGLPLPPPGLFPRKLYLRPRSAQTRRELVSRCRGEEAAFSCVAASGPRTTVSPTLGPLRPGAPRRVAQGRPPPRICWVLLQGHILSRQRSTPPPTHTPFPLLSLHTHTFRSAGDAVPFPLVG